MTATIRLPREALFYGGLGIAWIALVFLVHGRYQYFDRPIPAAAFIQNASQQLREDATLRTSIAEMQKNVAIEKDPVEKGHTFHNIGLAYYDLYIISRQRSWLDSVGVYFVNSLKLVPNVARFHYNFGRLMTEVGRHQAAQREYLAAIAIEPTHVLALHNVALLNYYELHQPDTAAHYLQRALAINPNLPICNYMLGEIALDKKDYATARDHMELEIALSEKGYGGGDLPARIESIEYALSLTHLDLMGLYSSAFPDRVRAQKHLDAYLTFEHNPKKREEAINQMKRSWAAR
jgi:tetratricopeptide (TPR) repeat protein